MLREMAQKAEKFIEHNVNNKAKFEHADFENKVKLNPKK